VNALYTPPILLFNAHAETIYPSLFRTVTLAPYQRERIPTPDQDFLDLDWISNGSTKLVIISHGLEGNSHRAYIKGMAAAACRSGFDVLAWNYRGCSEEMNRQLRFYHSGATDDLQVVVTHAIRKGYTEISLVGFSLGGNLTLKYLGEQKPPSQIAQAVVFSVPMELHSSCLQISKPTNWIYSNRFLRSLKKKVKAKSEVMPELDISGLHNVSTLIEFDDHFTAPIHGFNNALDYYQQCSSIRFVNAITTKTLIVNAQNDPFLSAECYPEVQLKNHAYVTFESPRHGGHVGFSQFNKNGLYWSEERAMNFLTQH